MADELQVVTHLEGKSTVNALGDAAIWWGFLREISELPLKENMRN